MAGTIIADYIRTDANKLSLNVGNTTFATINAMGLLSNTGVQIINQNGQVGAGLIGTDQLASSSVTQSKLSSGIAGNGPAFYAYMSNTMGASATVFTNVACNTELFDTASCFNNTGSTVGGIPAYAFMPNVAGYYQVNCAVYNQAANQVNILRLYKNGSYLSELTRLYLASAPTLNGAVLVYLNGTTDYIQLYFYCSANTTVGSNDGALVWFSGSLVRSA